VRKLGLVVVGLGAFLIATGLLVRLYAYPTLAVAPKGQESVTTLVGPDATIFDTSTFHEIQTDLTTTVVTTGDVPAADEQGNGVVVWESKSSTKSSDGVVRGRDIERVAFDAHTAEAVNCCGEYLEEEEGTRVPLEHQGLLVKFPFDTQKKTYDFWDGSLKKTVPIEYVDTETIEGMETYKFEQTIPPTEIGEREVPASLLGESGDGNLTAQSMYANVRTLWVEPNTGVIINRSETQNNTIAYNGEDRIVTTNVVTGYDETTIKGNVDKYAQKAKLLNLAKSVLPWTLGLLGLLGMAVGFLLHRRGDSDGAAVGDDGTSILEPVTEDS
jgi:Porin PorA